MPEAEQIQMQERQPLPENDKQAMAQTAPPPQQPYHSEQFLPGFKPTHTPEVSRLWFNTKIVFRCCSIASSVILCSLSGALMGYPYPQVYIFLADLIAAVIPVCTPIVPL